MSLTRVAVLSISVWIFAAVSVAFADSPENKHVPIRQFEGQILITEGEPTEQVRDIFWNWARRYQARFVVIAGEEPTEAECQYPWQIRGSVSTAVVQAADIKTAEDAEKLAKLLQKATAIWLEKLPSDLAEETRKLLRTQIEEANQNAECELGGSVADLSLVGLRDWLPQARFQREALDSGDFPAVAVDAYRISLLPGDALRIHERDIANLGRRPIRFGFAANGKLAEETFTLLPSHRHDLVSLARAIHFRWPSEADKKIEPSVPKGSLVIVGGGGVPRGLTEKFIELAGGPESTIVVLPTALDNAEVSREEVFEVTMLEKTGAKNVKLLSSWRKKDVDSEEFRDIMKDCTGLWFGGGRQWRFVDAYAGTQAIALFHDVLARGGVIGGSSAGASIQGDFMCRGNPLGNLEIDSFGYQQGFNFLPGTAIDQHFTQRNRLPELTRLIERRPQFLGIGLDETTAIVVQGSKAEVVGRGNAFFLDGDLEKNEPPKVTKLKAGEVYDLARRKAAEEE